MQQLTPRSPTTRTDIAHPLTSGIRHYALAVHTELVRDLSCRADALWRNCESCAGRWSAALQK